MNHHFWIDRYDDTRYWAVYDGNDLVCVCVYKKGTKEVKRRLEELLNKIKCLEKERNK